MKNSIVERLKTIQSESDKRKIYVLVDGAQYDRFCTIELFKCNGVMPLFDNVDDRDIAFAGPWLLSFENVDDDLFCMLNELELKYPSISWLLSSLSFDDLFIHLKKNLEVIMPNNKIALLRYYDPRILVFLPEILTSKQLKVFLSSVITWGCKYNDEDYYII
ncbi:uncharacterized protein DUF4123 [Raoultella sp. BIGb0149]|uniref:DUF4123 domain-containing protein n=1 Tax=Raoultella sp. BIGb0149 TaxID=2485116 RepID=UPI0010617215|nr:DUF4123 domain-containing protein [Raoultella sp. BIGb0149]TDQ24489.1 uncharacterized protein DUF4123 [Raoultella sp. BIGb0149]